MKSRHGPSGDVKAGFVHLVAVSNVKGDGNRCSGIGTVVLVLWDLPEHFGGNPVFPLVIALPPHQSPPARGLQRETAAGRHDAVRRVAAVVARLVQYELARSLRVFVVESGRRRVEHGAAPSACSRGECRRRAAFVMVAVA